MHRATRILLAACAALAASGAIAAEAPKAESKAYTLVYLKTGPQSGKLPEAENQAAFAGHFSNMQRLADERKLLIAGPFGKVRHDPGLRGIFILDTAKRAEAEAWASTDPPTRAGIFVLEYHDISSSYSFLAALERHAAREAKAKEEKRELKMEDTLRPYVWLIADDGAKAKRELAPLLEKRQVFWIAELDGQRLMALLDAASVEAAKASFADTFAKVGSYQLDEWYATNELANP